MDEILMAIECIKPTIEVINLRKENQYPKYESLTLDERKTVKKFVKVREKADDFSLKMIHLESSVQLVFYLTLLIANLNEVPLMEMNYNLRIPNLATTRWIFTLMWFFLKTLLSGLTTFSSIFKKLKTDSYKSTGCAPSIIKYIFVVLGVITDLMFSATTCFLLRSY